MIPSTLRASDAVIPMMLTPIRTLPQIEDAVAIADGIVNPLHSSWDYTKDL